MADDGTTTTDDGGAPPEGTPAKTFDETYVKNLRTEAATHRTNLRTAETERDAAIKERDDALGKITGSTKELADAQTARTAAETRALRFEVALEKGVPHTMALRLIGGTREELEADADNVLKLMGTPAPFKEQGKGTTPPPAGTSISDAIRSLALGSNI